MRKENVKYDCSHFQGHIPCKPNKQFDVQCDNCSYYENAPSAIVHLDTKQLLLNEIYKICNFEKREYVYETVDVEKSRTKEDNKDIINEKEDMQLSFFQLDDPTLIQIKEQIAGIDINTLTPVEALMKLNEIKKLIGK